MGPHINVYVVFHTLVFFVVLGLGLKEPNHPHLDAREVGVIRSEDSRQSKVMLVIRINRRIQAVVVIRDLPAILVRDITLVPHKTIQIEGMGVLHARTSRVCKTFPHIAIATIEELWSIALFRPVGELLVGAVGRTKNKRSEARKQHISTYWLSTLKST